MMAAATIDPSQDNIIVDGRMVIAQMHDADKSTNMMMISSLKEQKVYKSKVSVKAAVGQPFGSVFHVSCKVMFGLVWFGYVFVTPRIITYSCTILVPSVS